MYSTGKPRSRNAITICSLSALLTRGSLAPCTTRSGALILAADFSGDCLWSWERPAGVFGFPIRSLKTVLIDSQYGGMELSSVMRLDGPTIDTPAAYTSGVNARPASVA